ncbi:MAG: hypothetical protein ICV63_21400, partial [Coleofasciculus sp. Co-bin14]|nr:hypothetical protein [Coleofasciculus sp. Co-bin14]
EVVHAQVSPGRHNSRSLPLPHHLACRQLLLTGTHKCDRIRHNHNPATQLQHRDRIPPRIKPFDSAPENISSSITEKPSPAKIA